MKIEAVRVVNQLESTRVGKIPPFNVPLGWITNSVRCNLRKLGKGKGMVSAKRAKRQRSDSSKGRKGKETDRDRG